MVKVFVILSGIGDKPCALLGGETPLEAAETQNLDYISSNGNSGYIYALNAQVSPKSDESLMALLGYDPHQHYTGGGPLAAYGSGFNYKDGWLALKTNFSTIENKKIIERRAGRSLTTKEAVELAEDINKKLKFEVPFIFMPTVGHEGFLVFRENLSANISNMDPAYRKVGKFGVTFSPDVNIVQKCRALDPDQKTKLAARLVNEFAVKSHKILECHEVNEKRKKKYLLPANVVIPRDAGNSLPNLEKKKNWAAVISTANSVAISKLAGMNVLNNFYRKAESTDIFENVYDSLDRQISDAKTALKNKTFENLFVYFNQADICGMENRPGEKKKVIEIIDKKFINFLLDIAGVEIVAAGDHSTPCEMKARTSNPVPVVHYGKGKSDEVQRFTEKECINGGYRKIIGKDLLNVVGFTANKMHVNVV